jgi:hypothetical protein
MPQHLWRDRARRRVCEVCNARQTWTPQGWKPEVSSICPGDDDHNRYGPHGWAPPRWINLDGGGAQNEAAVDVALAEPPRQPAQVRGRRSKRLTRL